MHTYYSMFKAYDIRAKIPDIDGELFYRSGYALVTSGLLNADGTVESVRVMYDTRLFSEEFAQYLMQGIVDAGGSVINLGMGTTDMLYSACVAHDCSGIQVTASHNPGAYHGMKIVKRPPQMVGLDSGLDIIRDMVCDDARWSTVSVTCASINIDLEERNKAVKFLLDAAQDLGQIDKVNQTLATAGRRLRIPVDCGNGAGGQIMPYLAQLYTHIEFIPLYWEPDGNFPNHPADPQNYENLRDLCDAVITQHCDVGVAFDGDADRAMLIDEKGQPVDGDFLVALFTGALLDEYKVNAKWQQTFKPVIATIQPNSRCVWETIAEHDGVGVICKQGHTFVKRAMAEYNGLYGGEYSNHHYFAHLKGMDSGVLPVVLFIRMLVLGGYASASDMFASLRATYFITELMNLTIPSTASWADWKAKLQKAFADGTQSELDGFSVYYPDWKFSMRPSNTEPVVRFILETRGRDMREEKVHAIKSLLST